MYDTILKQISQLKLENKELKTLLISNKKM